MRTYKILHRRWRAKRPLLWGMVPELLGTIAVLVLFGVQQPDLFRSVFWKVGAELGYNSNPVILLYAYANHTPLPTIPFVWSQTLTNFNVAISIVSLFVLLAKLIMVIMKVYYPILALVLSMAQTALYAVSVYGQMGPDYLDPKHPSPIAWYIRYSCDVADKYRVGKHCAMAKGTFAVTVFMLALYLFNLGFAAWAMWPNPELDLPEDDDDDDHVRSKEEVEMQPTEARATPAMPFTPRTQAFNTLEGMNRKLPLRQQYA